VGNIYASEVLFQSGIHPACPAKELTDASLTRLHAAIREVLARAVGRGGTTLRDFASADGQMGHFQSDVTVYGREGMPCVACGHTIRKIVQGQRSTYFCAVCQPI
jgi:formamidopyrimidine-DNA glycosylase